jgi:hypothetical protein
VVATTVMAIKATPKVLTLIEKAEEEKGEELTKWETVKVAAPTYIPTVVTGVATVACMLGANIISKRQQATLMSAYALLDNSYKEYKKKVDELYGEEAGKQIRAGIAKDKYTGDGLTRNNGLELFYDFYSGRYFESTRENVLWAQYETNRALALEGGVSINVFYDFVGLEPLPEYNHVGWTYELLESAYWDYWIEFGWEDIVIDDDDGSGHAGLECTIIHIPHDPVMNFEDFM